MPGQSQQVAGTQSGDSVITTTPAAPDRGSNTDRQRQIGFAQAGEGEKVSGPIGRAWNHVHGRPDGDTGTGALAADRAMIRAYLDKRLKLAEGEFFRGRKLDGVTDKLMEILDKDKDGKVSWPEFKAYEDQVFDQIAPGARPGDSAEKVRRAADAQFTGADQDRSGSLDLDEVSGAAERRLPKGTDHASLIGQLAGRVVIDAADRDEGQKPVAQRSLTRDEYAGAAEEIAASRRR
jgi:hypothetical protein